MAGKVVIVLLIAVLALAPAAYADTVTTRDGEKLEGRITKETGEYVRLDTGYGTLTIPLTDIEKIEKSGGQLEDKRGGKRKPAKKLSGSEIQKLHREARGFLKRKKYDEAIAAYEKIVANDPGDAKTQYNLACACSLGGRKEAAVGALEAAIKAGYTAFGHMGSDPDLENIRGKRSYKSLIARKDRLLKNFGRRRAEQLKRELGPKGYVVETDRKRKIIYATNEPRPVLKEIMKTFGEYADMQWKTLFDNKPAYHITVIPSKRGQFTGGNYRGATRTVTCGGIERSLRHEFTHALHISDADARGQRHPIWITEAFATCFETSEIIDGVLTPMYNFRLNNLRKMIAEGRYVPWEKFFKMSQYQWESTGGSYGESRYIFYYFYHKGKLKKWYDTYCANYDKDRTGKLAVEKIFGKPLAEVEEDCKRWIAHAPEHVGGTPKGAPFFGVSSVGTQAGIRVDRVVPDSPADEAGVKAGDFIIEFAGKRYTNKEVFLKLLRAQEVGKPVKVKVLRGSRKLNLEVKLEPRK